MARTKQTARKSTGGKAPRKQLLSKIVDSGDQQKQDARQAIQRMSALSLKNGKVKAKL